MRLDIFYTVLAAAVFSLADHYLIFRVFWEMAPEEPAHARRWFWRVTAILLWLVAAVGFFLWRGQGRTLGSLGLVWPPAQALYASAAGVGLIAAYYIWVLVKARTSPRLRAGLRRQLDQYNANLRAILPHSGRDVRGWLLLSLTAGVTEEFIFRGVCLTATAQLFGVGAGVAVNVALFASGHAYQGWKGIANSALGGAVLTAVTLLTHSLLPAMAVHALVDLGGGLCALMAEEPPGAA